MASILSAIVVRAIEHHRMRVRFFETIELEQEMAIGKPGRLRTGWFMPICDSYSDFQTALRLQCLYQQRKKLALLG
jgi:hypothetical protein